MNVVCYVACAVAVLCSLTVIAERNAMRALLNLIGMMVALGVLFFVLGAPFVGVLELSIYAGAIMVLFVFVVMMLNPGALAEQQERAWLGAALWIMPAILTLALLALSVYALWWSGGSTTGAGTSPRAVGIALYRDYAVAVELASLLLLAGLIAAWHLAPPTRSGDSGDLPGGASS